MTAKQKIAFIINPVSGKGKNRNLAKLLSKKFNSDAWEHEILFTKYQGHASELVKECRQNNFDIVVAVGGDGTVNEVASAAYTEGLIMGIIPNGSGNGLARSLRIPINHKIAIYIIKKGHLTRIDLGSVQDRYFFCTCGSGFDAHIGYKFSKSETRGFKTYIKMILREFFGYGSKKFKLKLDGQKYTKRAFLVTVANAGQYGNNAYIAPKAKLNDGKLEVSVLKPFPWYKALQLALRLFARNIDRSRYIETFQVEKVTFRKKKEYEFHIDGEPLILQGPVKIRIIPKGLNVIVPAIPFPFLTDLQFQKQRDR
ncbi:MAG: diacylglycerol kinase family lipid kinase [Bacteroidales bacterium]|nr:diacylglycerol kinase family lipid kinase [Bacteroidales bacterium]MBN2820315.1 diacylglycerol kinase family lipid kinase [Bacteroidales bacterium]